jgi:hypothetical protein
MAANIAVHALRSGGRPLPPGAAREEADPALRYRYAGGPLEPVRGVWEAAAWRALPGSAPARISGGRGKLSLEVAPSEGGWAGVERDCPPGISSTKAVVLDLENRLPSSARVALRLRARGGALFESVPLYIRRGANADLRVPLDRAELRSTVTGWEGYDAALDRTRPIAELSLIIYARDLEGELVLSNLRLEGWGAGPSAAGP